MVTILDNGLAAIVSRLRDQPLVFGERSDPVDDLDSGWQFSSDVVGGGNLDKAEIWTLHEILEDDPSLDKLVDLPVGSIITRSASTEPWIVR